MGGTVSGEMVRRITHKTCSPEPTSIVLTQAPAISSTPLIIITSGPTLATALILVILTRSLALRSIPSAPKTRVCLTITSPIRHGSFPKLTFGWILLPFTVSYDILVSILDHFVNRLGIPFLQEYTMIPTA